MDGRKVAAVRHSEYYISDGSIIFLVENTLFNVHLSRLEACSPVFKDMSSFSPLENTVGEGSSDEQPIVLPGIREDDFTRFLWCVYPPISGVPRATSVNEWISILDQADRWQVDELKDLARQRLHEFDIDPIEKITLWERYHLSTEDIYNAYVALCSREKSFTEDEAQKLGLSTFVKVTCAREQAGRYKGYIKSAEMPRMIEAIVEDVFYM